MAQRGNFFRTRGRQSYKASEVIGLFVLSIIGGMLVCGLAVAIDFVFRNVFGVG